MYKTRNKSKNETQLPYFKNRIKKRKIGVYQKL